MNMEKKKSAIIDDYLKNSNGYLSNDFTEKVMGQIDELDKTKFDDRKNLSFFPLINTLGVCALILLSFINLSDSNHSAEEVFLEQVDKEIIENLMLLSEELTITEEYMSEDIYDLLVLLDT